MNRWWIYIKSFDRKWMRGIRLNQVDCLPFQIHFPSTRFSTASFLLKSSLMLQVGEESSASNKIPVLQGRFSNQTVHWFCSQNVLCCLTSTINQSLISAMNANNTYDLKGWMEPLSWLNRSINKSLHITIINVIPKIRIKC